jgi:diguanylate cyclase (GGDEF)-like protein
VDVDALQIIWANDCAMRHWSADSNDDINGVDFLSKFPGLTREDMQAALASCRQDRSATTERLPIDKAGESSLNTLGSMTIRVSEFEQHERPNVLLIELCDYGKDIDQEAHFQTVALTQTPSMISSFDENFKLVYSNPAAQECMTPECKSLQELLLNPSDLHIIFNGNDETDHIDCELEVNTRHGTQWHSMHIQLSTHPISGKRTYLLTASNATEQRRARQAAYSLAYNDSLTGLPNRAALNRFLEELLDSGSTESQLPFGIFFLDLDRFKVINDSLGHAAGDQLLIDTAQRLRQALGARGTVYRLGGDEFVMIVTDKVKHNELKKIAENVLFATAEPVTVSEHDIRVLPSIGICRFPEDGVCIDTLMEHADAAMYIAKAHKSGYCFYDEKMSNQISEKIKDRLGLENDLATAVENGEFELYFQPKVACRNLAVSSVEALIRWHHPSRGMVPPDKFIGIAEETGQIIDLGNWVLTAAMRQQRNWQDQGMRIPVSVNISARQFSANDLLANVSDALSQTGCDPHMIELEITESMLIGEPDTVHSVLQQLSSMGIRLALDDFGTGYSNLAYLQKYPLDCLKIDRIFLAEQRRSMLLGTILNIGKVLGVEVVAEGVETATQADWLIARGCDHMQGFYFSKPMPVTETTRYLVDNGVPLTSANDETIHGDRAA